MGHQRLQGRLLANILIIQCIIKPRKDATMDDYILFIYIGKFDFPAPGFEWNQYHEGGRKEH